ncbi:hypothetical protein M407DRAFT_242667 [Tulasnella calospora MUT 4182]|uniref:C2H2-type domain-containing protein n=1 Tax=Tulasnella calospora MUT 4182 TaxID=1051891 RepID=A0A0C3QPP3_9AGAM|nr:hypothetical protein M407DRAFT_242667 [Tulasnella calospora MUT 4182]
MFARPHDLRRHANIHTDILPFTCLACNKGFKRSDARQRHWKQYLDCKDLHMALEERGFDGGGKRRRSTKSQGRKAAENDFVTRRGSSIALPIAETNSSVPRTSLLGPFLNSLTRRASSTPLPDVPFPFGSSFSILTPFVTSAPEPSLGLFAGTDNPLFLDL